MNGIYFVSELLTFGIFAVLGLSARRWDDAMGRRVRTVSAAACGISLPMALVSLFCLLARPAWGRTLHRAAGRGGFQLDKYVVTNYNKAMPERLHAGPPLPNESRGRPDRGGPLRTERAGRGRRTPLRNRVRRRGRTHGKARF